MDVTHKQEAVVRPSVSNSPSGMLIIRMGYDSEPNRRPPQFAESVRLEFLEAYKTQLLPPNHPLTVVVNKVVAQLLEASDLGTVKSNHSSTSHPNEGSSKSDGDFSEDVVPGSGTREWTVMVVHDPKTANAMAAFGMYPGVYSKRWVVIVWCTANIVFFTGIVPVCEDEAGVAAVLAHGMWMGICRSCSSLNDSVEIGHVG
jgi:hypothetical protein